ncbi:MerR family transcriptional regulator [Crassaminicella profunda]|uniref:MerR family transcriptional regulator n=1 Tax=Crassaminicella profunda TaxID=1286698 RepID=UPI001CA7B3BC|nr:MerR family transcriptional regulator [Crassaminicella profunda]QZY56428.1 MerR family transcriptional regulator [Crassaminicella profunda]
MENKFLIGDMAKIHNISTQTLRYYDKIGLLKPKIIDENNGYRYYTIEQFEQLDTIKYLKVLGMTLKDIKEHFEKREIGNIVKLLEKQKHLTYKKIQELELIGDKIDHKIDCIKDCMNIEEYEKVRIREIFERNIVLEYIKDSDSAVEFELALKNLQNLFKDNSLMFTGKIGIIVPSNHLKTHRFDRYNAVYILVEDKFKHSNIKKLPAGKYACIYHKGSYRETYRSYKKLLDYLKDHHYEIIGDAIEIGLVDVSVTLNEEEYITEIQVPIK